MVQRYTRQDTYSGVVGKMYGKKMEIFVDIVQVSILKLYSHSFYIPSVHVLVMPLLLQMNCIFVCLTCFNVA